MYTTTNVLSCPADFNFPFTPYTIQQQLMQELYDVLENKQIVIFESPTGTGKSLTLTCAALKWLEDHEKLVRNELQQRLEHLQKEVLKLEKESPQVADWLTMHSKRSQQREEMFRIKELNELLQQYEVRLNEIMSKKQTLREIRSRGVQTHKMKENGLPDIEIDLNESVDLGSPTSDENLISDDKPERYRNVQIFFCSRTHTQLAQVVKEIKRTVYGERIRCVSLASRQQLCIHKQLRKLNNAALINERCLDMLKDTKMGVKTTSCDVNGCTQKKARTTKKSMMQCEFKTQALVTGLSELSLVDILDIEDLVTEGDKMNACPYYAARSATEFAQIIMLPYQLLLHKRTRQQCGIDLRGSVVIIDEAHNLLDTISNMYSCELNLQQLQILYQQILAYKMKYSLRFNSSNLLSINQILFVVKRLIKVLQTSTSDKSNMNHSFRILCTYELMSEGDFFNIDLYQLLRFCENSRFAQKLQGFVISDEGNTTETQDISSGRTATRDLLQRLQKNYTTKNHINFKECIKNKETQQPTTTNSSVSCHIRTLLSFLESLCDKAEDGRILIHKPKENVKNHEIQTGFKYILLNPGEHFQDIIKEARAVRIILTGFIQSIIINLFRLLLLEVLCNQQLS